MIFTRIKMVMAGLILGLLLVTTSLASAEALIQELSDTVRGRMRVSYHADTGMVRFLGAPPTEHFLRPFSTGADIPPEVAARSFMSSYGRMFGLSGQNRELSLLKSRELGSGRSVVKFKQVYRDLPVIAGEVIVNLDRLRNVTSVSGEISPNIDLDITARVDLLDARKKALAEIIKRYRLPEDDLEILSSELLIYNPILLGGWLNRNFLVWRMIIRSKESPVKEFILIDAKTGMTLLSFNQIHHARKRFIYDNKNGLNSWDLPGYGPVRKEGEDPSGIPEVDDAYDYLGDSYDFYSDIHSRDSIDDGGMDLIATVRYCDPEPDSECPYSNAYWNGSLMVFGDGFARADDVVGHELTHGVTDYESGLFYYMQSGAINESFSDIWGEFIDLWNGTGTDTPAVRWLIGEDLPASIGVIRSMKNPPAYWNPDSMLSPYYYCRGEDNGGVHWNSGVNNKLAYLLTDGGTFGNFAIAPLGMEKVAKLYYEVQTNLLTSGADYQDLADGLYQGCLNLISEGVTAEPDCTEVLKAVNAVDMFSLPAKCKNLDVPLCYGGTPTNRLFDDLENPARGLWQKGSGPNYWYYPQNPNYLTPDGFDATYATSGKVNIWGYDYGGTYDENGDSNRDGVSDYHIKMASSVTLPSSGNIFMHFNHAYGFEYSYDGGVLEYSTNNGATWLDAGALIVVNGYDGSISSLYGNPLKGREAFVGESHGYLSTKLDLSDLAGQSVRFRFRIGTDELGDSLGWFIDDVRIYTCSAPDPDSLTINAPSEGERYMSGAIETIRWQGPSRTAYVDLSYSLDDGKTWAGIEKNIPGNEYPWIVPIVTKNKTKCRIKLNGFGESGVRIGSAKSNSFAIEVLSVTSPNGGETLTPGGIPFPITWKTGATKNRVAETQLFFTLNNGGTWKLITAPLPGNPETYDWNVPQVKGKKSKCKVKIVLKDAMGKTVASDTSDGTFTINSP